MGREAAWLRTREGFAEGYGVRLVDVRGRLGHVDVSVRCESWGVASFGASGSAVAFGGDALGGSAVARRDGACGRFY